MSRHRAERVPRHRAQRPAGNPGRRVRVTAVVATAAGPALDTGPADPDTVTTAPLPAPVRGLPPRAGGHSMRPPRGSRIGFAGILRGATRGLAATPWFAAGTGFVLAAGLWMYSPHARLQFPQAAPNAVPCARQSCNGPVAGGTGSLAVTTPGVPIRHSRAAAGASAGASSGQSAAAGMTFTFTVLWQRQGTFGAMITVDGKRPAGPWRLAFRLPADTITSVMGASWRPYASGTGGVASALTGAATAAANGPADGGSQQHSVIFLLVGNGTPVTPSGCHYDGASCTFTVGSAPQG